MNKRSLLIFSLVNVVLLIFVFGWLKLHMNARGMPWSALGEINQLLMISAAISVLMLGFIISLVSQTFLMRDRKALRAQCEIDKANYWRSLKEKSNVLERQEKALRERSIQLDQAHLDQVQETKKALQAREREAEDAMKAAKKKKKKAKQLILETTAENKEFQLKALTASKMLERIRKKQQRGKEAKSKADTARG